MAHQIGRGTIGLCQRAVGIDIASAVAGINKLRTILVRRICRNDLERSSEEGTYIPQELYSGRNCHKVNIEVHDALTF